MKRALILLSILLGACSETAGDGKALIGKWVRTEDAQTCETFFRSDGAFTGRCFNRDAETWTFAGTWAMRGDLLSYEYKVSSLQSIPPGTKDTDKLIILAKDHYVIEGRDGIRRQYQRIDKTDKVGHD